MKEDQQEVYDHLDGISEPETEIKEEVIPEPQKEEIKAEMAPIVSKNKGTELFKKTIQKYLDDRSSSDEYFANFYKKEGKNIDDCITYIFNTVKESGCNGFEDSEIYSMAVHYYQEDNIDPGKNMDMKVIVNHTVQLTEEELKQARTMAIKQATDQAYKKVTKTKTKPVTTKKEDELTLF